MIFLDHRNFVLFLILYCLTVLNFNSIGQETESSPWSSLLCIDDNQREAVDFLINIGSIESPSGNEEERAHEVSQLMRDIGCAFVSIDTLFNVVGLIRGQTDSCIVFISTLDDLPMVSVNQQKVNRPLFFKDGKIIGPGSHTSSTIASLLLAGDCINKQNIIPKYTIVLAAVAQEETGLKGMEKVYNDWKDRSVAFIDILGDGETIAIGGMAIEWIKVIVNGPTGHTLNGFKPNVNEGLAKSISALFDLYEGDTIDDGVIINIGQIQSGSVFNHKPASGWFSLDIRSLNTSDIQEYINQLTGILDSIIPQLGLTYEIDSYSSIPGGQINQFDQSSLVNNTLEYVQKIRGDAQLSISGSSNMNIPISNNFPAIGLNGKRGDHRGEINEYANLDALIRTSKVVYLLMLSDAI